MKTLEERIKENLLASTQPRELSPVQMDAVTAAVAAWYTDATQALIEGEEHEVPDFWDSTVPPGGYVCSVCGDPVESEPCPKHQTAAYGSMS